MLNIVKHTCSSYSRPTDVHVTFVGQPILVHQNRNYFEEVMLLNGQIRVNDYVSVDGGEYRNPSYKIGRIMFMWSENEKKSFHVHWLANCMNTILGSMGNLNELFDTNDCDDLPISMIENKVDVTYLPIDRCSWITSENTSFDDWDKMSNPHSFAYQKLYNCNFGRFEDVKVVVSNENRAPDDCPYCELNDKVEQLEKPVMSDKFKFIQNTEEYVFESLHWRNEMFTTGSCVFLKSGTLFKVGKGNNDWNHSDIECVDEERYPEMYRKTEERKFWPDKKIIRPFDVGYIVSIRSTAASKKPESTKDVFLTVKKLYRPENTNLNAVKMKHLDLNLLYWSDEESVVSFQQVEGKCYVANLKNLSCSLDEWSSQGPYRFYYKEAFVSKEDKFIPAHTTSNSSEEIIEETPKSWPTLSTPLRSLGLFAGCGGLTEGLHQAGVANCCWAIEKEASAAHAFRLNYPNALVFTDDCYKLLELMTNGHTEKDGKILPQKGEVELVVGSPPCQGINRMNRFSDEDYSLFEKSSIVLFLAYVDHFRPRYVIMENVGNFVFFKHNMVLKLTIWLLGRIGYQCTFGVQQTAHFGVPLNSRRVIILAAAPGEVLPCYPEPTNSCEQNNNTLYIDGHKVFSNVRWDLSAPLRKLNVYDAISDLPDIKNGGDPLLTLSYDGEPKTHFQRLMRMYSSALTDHVSKAVTALVEKRITLIPKVPGSDWRDLPNIVVQLSDGSYTRKLVYTHRNVESHETKSGRFRGVCRCATGGKCCHKYKQSDTLIPWNLVHTADRNNHWSGRYGRLEWDDHFKSEIVNLDPLPEQGKVIHPDQNRILSVRELARLHGFPDKFKFFGTTQDRYRQISNAVPSPLAAALGREIAKSIAELEASKEEN